MTRRWEVHCELRRIVGRQTHTVKTIGKVNFDHVDGSPLRVGEKDVSQESFEGSPKLHCF